jgi:hypothetical protein
MGALMCAVMRQRRAPLIELCREIRLAFVLPTVVLREEIDMRNLGDQKGKIGYIILWLMGVPAGILILIFLLRGCT